jgi:UDP-glucose 4-epimerase
MRVLVTGGAGFIGSHLVEALVARGDEVTVIDDLSSGSLTNLVLAPRHLVIGDILDTVSLRSAFAFDPDVVVHLAAQVSVQASIDDPERDRAVNVEGTRAVVSHGVPVVFASSAAVYGDAKVVPTPETSPLRPVNPYGCSKRDAEAIVLGGEGTVSRFANVYGPRQSGAGEGGVAAHFRDRVWAGLPVVVNGDGEQTRDFIYVADIVTALMLCLERPSDRPMNICTGKATSIHSLAALFSDEHIHAPALEGEIVHSRLDPTLARMSIGFVASAELGFGVSETLSR